MTPLEQVLAARETSFLQVFVDGKGLWRVSLMDGGSEVAVFKKGSMVEALAELDGWLAGRLMEEAAAAFWGEGKKVFAGWKVVDARRAKNAARVREWRARKKTEGRK